MKIPLVLSMKHEKMFHFHGFLCLKWPVRKKQDLAGHPVPSFF